MVLSPRNVDTSEPHFAALRSRTRPLASSVSNLLLMLEKVSGMHTVVYWTLVLSPKVRAHPNSYSYLPDGGLNALQPSTGRHGTVARIALEFRLRHIGEGYSILVDF